jgi:hypothetical protein
VAITIKPGTKGVITLTNFMATPEFLACAVKQRRWLEALIESNFDYAAATSTAFDCSTHRNTVLYSYSVRRQPHIIAALNVYLGKSEREIDLEEVERHLRKAEPGSVAAQRLIAAKLRLKYDLKPEVIDEPQSAAPAVHRFHVGDIAIRADRTKLRVTAVDDEGRVTEGDPLP